MYLQRAGFPGLRSYVLAFVGTLEPEELEACAEYMDVICASEYRRACIDCLGDAIRLDQRVSCVSLARMHAHHATDIAGTLKTAFPVVDQRSAGYRFRITLGNGDANLGLSPKSLRNLQRKRRRFLELEGAAVRWADDSDSALEQFSILCDVHAQRWVAAGGTGVFDHPVFRGFHHALVQAWAREKKLLLFSLEVAGVPVTAHYCLLGDDTVYFYQSGVALDAYPSLSLGGVAHLFALEFCARENYAFYDLMAGAKDGYKRRFTEPDKTPLLNVSLYRNRGRWLVSKLMAKLSHFFAGSH